MIALSLVTHTSQDHVDIWGSLVAVGGGVVGAAVILTILAHMPGTRAVFRFAVRDPASRWIARTVKAEVKVSLSDLVTDEVAKQLAPWEQKLDSINAAVNNVGPGVKPMRERMEAVEHGVERLLGIAEGQQQRRRRWWR